MIEIRKAVPRQIDDVVRIALECRLSPWTRKDYLDEMQRVNSIFLVASDPTPRTVGFVLGRIVAGSPAGLKSAEIYNIGVLREFRRLEIGSKLVRDFCRTISGEGEMELFLEVRATNIPAVKFYEKLGFSVQYRRPSFYSNPVEDATVMHAIIKPRSAKKLESAIDLK